MVTKQFADGLAADSPITIFGDGSVKDGRGAHATHIYLAGSEYLDIQSATIAVAILINNAVITDTTMGKRIRQHITGRPLRNYLLQTNKWTKETMELVDWNTLGKYTKTVLHNKKTTNLVKLMHGWQFSTTGRQSLMRTDDDDDDTGMNRDCPLGCGCREDDHHYLVCEKQPGIQKGVL